MSKCNKYDFGYIETHTINESSIYYNVSPVTIRHIIKKNNLKYVKNENHNEKYNQIKNDLLAGIKPAEITKKYAVSRQYVHVMKNKFLGNKNGKSN